MKPTAPSYLTPAKGNAQDLREERQYEEMLRKDLDRRTKLEQPPSQHVLAWHDFERAWFFARGRNPSSDRMGYNLWTDAARGFQHAHALLTDDEYRENTGRQKRTTPRLALAAVAETIGYRYQRGLEVIEAELSPVKLAKFRSERVAFRHAFERYGDTAHRTNETGKNPAAALEVVHLFRTELLALCPWLEKTGNPQGAELLREACVLPLKTSEQSA
jgi:hypothetical protein